MARSSERQRAIGAASEQTARLAIEALVADGVLTGYREDAASNHSGVDFHLIRPDGARVPLQVKSSAFFAAHHRTRHPHIPVIVVGKRGVHAVQRSIMTVLRRDYP